MPNIKGVENMIDLSQTAIQGLTIFTVSGIVTALVEALKRTKGLEFLEGRYDIVAIVLAMIISLLGGLDVFSGLIAGLSAMGLYDATVQRITGER
jgi:hypothetical protein